MKRFSSFMPIVGALLVGGGAACGAAGGGTESDQMYGGGSNASNAASSGNAQAAAGSDAGAATVATTGTGTTTTPAGGDDAGAGTGTGTTPTPAPIVTDPFASLKQGADQLAAFCARGGADVVTTSLCASPSIGSLADLQKTVGLAFKDPNGGNGAGGNPAFVMLGHSASLAMRSISSANPRAVLMSVPAGWQPGSNIAMNADGEGPPPQWEPPAASMGWTQPSDWQTPTWFAGWGWTNSWPPAGWDTTPPPSNPVIHDGVAMGYSRGTDIVELAANDPKTNALKFVAVRYTRPIKDGTASGTFGTDTGDFSAESEKSWASWTPYDDTDLANTTVDCTHCHQTGGPGTQKVLRMNEIETPWTHSMSNWTAGGQALLGDFHSVHGTAEDYGGIPAAMIEKSEPDTLQLMAQADTTMKQPIKFDSGSIENEVAASNAAQPQDNSMPGASATWNKLFSDGLAAHVVVPYHDVKVTDPAKLAAAATAYQGGGADLSDLMSDDAKTATLLTPSSTFDAPTLLGAACADCHNSHVPTTIGRGQFDATNIAGMSRAEKNVAIARLQLTTPDVLHMPPVNVHELSATQVQALITYLQQ